MASAPTDDFSGVKYIGPVRWIPEGVPGGEPGLTGASLIASPSLVLNLSSCTRNSLLQSGRNNVLGNRTGVGEYNGPGKIQPIAARPHSARSVRKGRNGAVGSVKHLQGL